jgi:hypothetical protein
MTSALQLACAVFKQRLKVELPSWQRARSGIGDFKFMVKELVGERETT